MSLQKPKPVSLQISGKYTAASREVEVPQFSRVTKGIPKRLMNGLVNQTLYCVNCIVSL